MKLLILDSNNILNRAFYGIKVLTTKEGLYTNGDLRFFDHAAKDCGMRWTCNAVAVAF